MSLSLRLDLEAPFATFAVWGPNYELMSRAQVADPQLVAFGGPKGSTGDVTPDAEAAREAAELAANQAAESAAVALAIAASATAANRTALAAMPPNAKAVTLTEAGREGLFLRSTANLAAKVTADPQQGLYVAFASDPTGASGGYVRSMGPNNLYRGEWWGLDAYAGNTADAILNPLFQTLLPKGAHFRLPVCDITVSDIVRVRIEGVHLFGVSQFSSGIHMKAGVEKDTIHLERPGCHVHDLGIYGAYSEANAGEPFAIAVSPQDSGMYDGFKADVYDCHVYNNYIESHSGVIFLAYHDGTQWYEARDGSCHHNTIKANYQAISLFGATRIDAHHNNISVTWVFDHAVWFIIRMVGSIECDVYSNIINGPGQSFGGIYGVCVATHNYSGHRRQAYDCTIRDNVIRYVAIGMAAVEWDHTISFKNNRCLNNTAGTEVVSIAFYSFPSNAVTYGVAETGGDLIVEGNHFEGFASSFKFGGKTRSVRCKHNTFIGNKNSGGEGNSYAIQSLDIISVRHTEITHNRFIQKDGTVFNPITITGTNLGEQYYIHDNVLGERDSALGARPIFGTSGSGTIHNASTDEAGTVASASPAAGDNVRHPVGSHEFYLTGVWTGAGSGGGCGITERAPNPTFDTSADVTLGAGASITGGALHVGTGLYDPSYEALLGSYADGETYDLVVDVSTLGDATTRVEVGPSWAAANRLSTVLLSGVNNLSFTVSSGTAGTDMRLTFQVYAGGATSGAVINSVSVQLQP